jgi:hypothetical protein
MSQQNNLAIMGDNAAIQWPGLFLYNVLVMYQYNCQRFEHVMYLGHVITRMDVVLTNALTIQMDTENVNHLDN